MVSGSKYSELKASQDKLVDYLMDMGLVKNQRVADAMRQVDRNYFINNAYATGVDAYQVKMRKAIQHPGMPALGCPEIVFQ